MCILFLTTIFLKTLKKLNILENILLKVLFTKKKKIPQQTQQELSAGIHNLETKQ